ncbi:MAG TPA: NUDIX domain-containing protein [Candidatus Woesebacteria bacterium]|nr:NUDIX domain-containing protein [Candidatus Woesebacteria bacterium]
MTDIQLTDEELNIKVRELMTEYGGGNDESTDNGEMQDVVNSMDEVVGSLPRGVIWDNDLQGQTRVVNIFVVDQEDNVLLPIRSMEKRYLPGGYDFSCGENLKAGEDYEEGVIRGLREELGIEGEQPKEMGSFAPDHGKGFFCFGKVYLIEVGDKSEVTKFNTDEIERLEWKSKDEILEMIEDEPEKFKRDYEGIFRMAFGLEK